MDKSKDAVFRTRSGARISTIAPDVAEDFFDRLGIPHPPEIWAAFGAYADHTALVGVAVLGASHADDGRFMVAVAPHRRRLGIGSELLEVLKAEAGQRALGSLRITLSSENVDADAFLRAVGPVRGRLAVNGRTSIVLGLGEPRRHLG